MDPPHLLNAESMRTEKLKVLQALRPISNETINEYAVRGQYVAGTMGDKDVPGYLEELGGESKTETYVAIKAFIDNWRWQGVPFYLRTGKRLNKRCAEITVQFKPVSHNAFGTDIGKANRLIIRIQPNEGMQLRITSKQLNKYEMSLQPVLMNLDFAETFDNIRSDAYQRLLMNVIENDLSLFAHRDEIDLAWAWVDPILNAWKDDLAPLHQYPAGSWGPEAAEQLTEDGHNWINAGMK
jgi:glucose-6-phosphate 1-dehydrogenase